MKTFVQAIAHILEKNKTISQNTARALAADFNNRSKIELETFLLGEGLVSKEELLKAFSEYFQVPEFDVEGYFFSHMILRQFPKHFLLSNIIIPVEVLAGDNIITMVANNPSDESLLPNIGKHASYDVLFFVGLAQDILDQIQDYYDEPLTVSDEYDEIPAEEEEEKKALEIAEKDIDKTE